MRVLMDLTVLSEAAPVAYGILIATLSFILFFLFYRRFRGVILSSLCVALFTLYVYYQLVVGFIAGYFIGLLVPILKLMKYPCDFTITQTVYRITFDPTIPWLYVLNTYFLYNLAFYWTWSQLLLISPIFCHVYVILGDMHHRNHVFEIQNMGPWESTLDETVRTQFEEITELKRIVTVEQKRVAHFLMEQKQWIEEKEILEKMRKDALELAHQTEQDEHTTCDFLLEVSLLMDEMASKLTEHPHLKAQSERLVDAMRIRIQDDEEERLEFEVKDERKIGLFEAYSRIIPNSEPPEPEPTVEDLLLLKFGHKPRDDGPKFSRQVEHARRLRCPCNANPCECEQSIKSKMTPGFIDPLLADDPELQKFLKVVEKDLERLKRSDPNTREGIVEPKDEEGPPDWNSLMTKFAKDLVKEEQDGPSQE